MKTFIVTIMCIGLALSSMAQVSPFLQKGQSGFGVGAGLEQGAFFDGFSVKAGTSIKGVFDIEVNYYHDQIDQHLENFSLLSDDACAGYTEIRFTWWLLRSKPSNFIDVNFGITPGVELGNYNHYEYKNEDNQTVEYKGYHGGELGLSSNIVFHLEKNWMLMPFYNLYYEVGHDKESIGSNESETNYHGFTSTLGVTLGKQLKKGNSLYLSFRQSSDTYGSNGYYNVEVGYVLPW
jgi:hypothetical protein